MTLVRSRDVIPFDLDYFHPGLVPGESQTRYILYREIFADERPTLSADETRRILYAIYRRGYRVRYPLEHPNFQVMLEQLESRMEIGSNPEVLQRAGIEVSS
ncbi:MAG: hypothetical protein KY459_11020 [Acidobacteria bacterium]|nr:hypothetical protein [Acidobacteriota bacterium]